MNQGTPGAKLRPGASSLITHHLSLITHHSSLITHHSSLTTHQSPLTTHEFCGTTITSFTGVPIGGSSRVSLSSFKYFSSFIVKLVWKTVSSVTGKMEMSVPVMSAP